MPIGRTTRCRVVPISIHHRTAWPDPRAHYRQQRFLRTPRHSIGVAVKTTRQTGQLPVTVNLPAANDPPQQSAARSGVPRSERSRPRSDCGLVPILAIEVAFEEAAKYNVHGRNRFVAGQVPRNLGRRDRGCASVDGECKWRTTGLSAVIRQRRKWLRPAAGRARSSLRGVPSALLADPQPSPLPAQFSHFEGSYSAVKQ
jgi:hypothetical protein